MKKTMKTAMKKGMKACMKKSMKSSMKRVMKTNMKKPSRAVLRPAHLRNKIVIQMDETLTNATRKKSRLAKSAKPRRNHIWVAGAVVEDRPDLVFFRVLKHPADAFEGKPRGKKDMLDFIEDAGI